MYKVNIYRSPNSIAPLMVFNQCEINVTDEIPINNIRRPNPLVLSGKYDQPTTGVTALHFSLTLYIQATEIVFLIIIYSITRYSN